VEYLGLGKVQYGSSVCRLNFDEAKLGHKPDAEIFLTERASQIKADGGWPSAGIEYFLNSGRNPDMPSVMISENRDAQNPLQFEQGLNEKYPFYDWLRKNGLDRFSRKFNPDIQFLSHHYCHAMAAVAMSPYTRSLIVVMDGAGTEASDFGKGHFEKSFLPEASLRKNKFEECSVYLQDGPNLRCVLKRWQTFRSGKEKENYRGWTMSEGLGIFYEESAKYIFNSIREAGKVMGLSPYGKPKPVLDRLGYLKDLDWDEAFHGKGKKQWEDSGRFTEYANFAATVQNHFEEDLFALLKKMNKAFPDVKNLIFTGGCALNCIANMKIVYSGLFESVYVPPFPSDECISFGAAQGNYISKNPGQWSPLDWSLQKGNFGPKSSIPDLRYIENIFSGFNVHAPEDICSFTADLLAKKKIIAWYQDRSESGPRALGNRSILARIDVPGLKDKMNAKVKGREAFRPYGSSCTLESAPEYFEVPQGFESPFMSFAPRVRSKHKKLLKEVTHVNGTSRIQTVSRTQNPRFWALLNVFGQKTGLPCLLNTSLNIMGQPIVETMKDAKEFLERTPVDGLVIDDLYISRKPLKK
jgi:carbamoyltransferase